MVGIEQIHDLVEVWGLILSGAPGLPELGHFVKGGTVGEGAEDGVPPGMGLEQELFELGEFGFEGSDAVFEGLSQVSQLLSGHGCDWVEVAKL
jgi:hypothetical protein